MSYPSFIRDNLGDLADYLLEPCSDGEKDEQGTMSNATQKEIDTLLQKAVIQEMRHHKIPPNSTNGTDPNNRWRTVSCLQKSIRFGDPDMAQFAAYAAYDMDPAYLFRRLGVIATEDVGVANPFMMLACLAVLGSKEFRQMRDERRLACFLAERMANGLKDRALTDLVIISDYNRELDKEPLALLTDDELKAMAVDNNHGLDMQMTAATMLAGQSGYPGESFPPNKRSPHSLPAFLVEQKLSRMSVYASLKARSRTQVPMWPGFLYIDRWLSETTSVTVDASAKPSMTKVGLLLGAAYDMHTREGKAAIGKFRKENTEVLGKYLSHAKPGMESMMLYLGLFVAEGGVLNEKLVYDNVTSLRSHSQLVELSHSGLPPELHDDFIAALVENLPELNSCREKVLWAKLQS